MINILTFYINLITFKFCIYLDTDKKTNYSKKIMFITNLYLK